MIKLLTRCFLDDVKSTLISADLVDTIGERKLNLIIVGICRKISKSVINVMAGKFCFAEVSS